MQIIEVNDRKTRKAFLDVPHQIYQSDPEWVCHLDQDIEGIFDPAVNREFKNGDAVRFILTDGKKLLGRIAAFFRITNGTTEGACGFFECINNQNAANLLFDAAREWLLKNNCTYMDGPVNFGERDKYWGLLVKGFVEPSYQENYNPPYYQQLFENYGFTNLFEQTTSEISRATFQYERFSRLSERVFRNPAYRFEHFKTRELKRFAADFIHIYNKAWAHRPDFVPITMERIENTLHSLKPIMIEEAIWFVYANDEPAGFYVNVLDVNRIFKHLKGKMNLWAKIKFLWYRYTLPMKRLRGIVFGIIPEYQNLGLETGMIIRFQEAMYKNYPQFTNAELSWVGDFNPRMLSLYNALGATPTKLHITYRYAFGQ